MISKEKAKSILGDVPSDKYFWLCNGKILKNLKELEKELGRMDFDIFHYHVNPYKNDFSRWINDVIQDRLLANEVRNLKTRRSIARHIKKRIYYLEGIIKKKNDKKKGKLSI